MKFTSAILIIIGFVILGAIAGACLGCMIGLVEPNYYRSVFPGPISMGVEPSMMGLGLGLIQGGGVGIVIAFALILLFVWRETRLQLRKNINDLIHEVAQLRTTVSDLKQQLKQ